MNYCPHLRPALKHLSSTSPHPAKSFQLQKSTLRVCVWRQGVASASSLTGQFGPSSLLLLRPIGRREEWEGVGGGGGGSTDTQRLILIMADSDACVLQCASRTKTTPESDAANSRYIPEHQVRPLPISRPPIEWKRSRATIESKQPISMHDFGKMPIPH